jgi:hypothetical protein
MTIEREQRFETKGGRGQRIVRFLDDIRQPNNPEDQDKNCGNSIEINYG